MSGNKCFVCTGEIQNETSERDSSSSEENSILLCKILEMSDEGNETKKFGGRNISYCRVCLNKILNIGDMLEELERLEKKVLDAKYSIELQLKEKEKSQDQSFSGQLRSEIGAELRTASIGSMLAKIRKKRVGQRRNSKGSHHIRIMESVTIPNIVCETIQPISHDQYQPGNIVVVTSQESQSQLVHQDSFLLNNQSLMINDDSENQVGVTPSQKSPTANANMTETSCIEECDIKYEIQSDTDMAIDPLYSEMEHMDLPQQNGLIDQISTKIEIDLHLPDVSADAQLTTTPTIEDSSRKKSFICGTCQAEFVSYNQLRIHDRMHFKSVSGKSSRVKTIHRREGKSSRQSSNRTPSLRPKKCEECGKVLSCKETWTYHVMSIHRGEYRFKCTMCDFGCQKPSQFKAHIMSVHSVNIEDLKCSKCDRVFESKLSRATHMMNC